MFKTKYYCFIPFLIISLSLILFGCNEKHDYSKTSKEAIIKVKEKFPTLIYSSDKKIKEISIRKVSVENDSIEINLIKLEGDEDENTILVFKNKENHYYAIPIFSTLHRDYWEFKNDSILKKFPNVKSTFREEFIKMLNVLKFNNTEFRTLYYETFENVLEWKFINSIEDLKKEYNVINVSSYYLINNDNSEKSVKRINNNIDILINSFKKYQSQIVSGNGIIIEFANYEDYIFKKKPLIINCFRQDSNIQRLSL